MLIDLQRTLWVLPEIHLRRITKRQLRWRFSIGEQIGAKASGSPFNLLRSAESLEAIPKFR